LVAIVTADSEGLMLALGRGQARRLSWVNGLTFAQGQGRYTFVRRGDEVTGLLADQVGGYLRLGKSVQ
jgi:hypothetical protein